MYNKWIKIIVMLTAWGGFMALSSCEDDLTAYTVDKDRYEVNEHPCAFLRNVQGDGKNLIDLYNAEGEQVELNIQLTKPVTADTKCTLIADESLLINYNQIHGTNFAIFPIAQVVFENGKVVTVEAGNLVSESVKIKLEARESLETGKTYVLPIRIESASDIALSEDRDTYYYLIKAQGDRINPQKDPDVKVMSCFGLDWDNPLIHTQMFLKKSGKPLFDIVCLFSAGINYNAETGQAYVYKNPNIVHLLNNRDKYIKPLQDMGIKVVMGLCGNRDFTGCGSMLPEACKQFARELKNLCDQYGLDGVLFDDEYSSYGVDIKPGFSSYASSANASRLCYETKKLMPDRLIIPFLWGSMSYLQSVDGMTPGEYCDYFFPNYNLYPSAAGGAQMKQMGAGSQELTGYQWYARNYGDLSRVNSRGYGLTTVFGMGPYQEERKSGSWLPWSTQKKSLDIIARDIFDDEVVCDEVMIRKDW